jgi:hypothetical protein
MAVVIVIPADGPSFFTAPSGKCMCMLCVSMYFLAASLSGNERLRKPFAYV